MPDLRELDLNQPQLAHACAYMLKRCARWIILNSATGLTCDNCIMSARVAVEVMLHYGVRDARAEAVAVSIGNPRYVNLIEQHGRPPESEAELRSWIAVGAWIMQSSRDGKTTARHWHGHLVAVGGGVLVDLSADQFSRPGAGIELEEVIGDVPRAWQEGRERAAWLSDNGSVIIYERDPENASWQTALDWTGVHLYQDVIDEIIDEINALEEPATLVRGSEAG